MTWFYKQTSRQAIVWAEENEPNWQIFGYGDCQWTQKVIKMLADHKEKNVTFKDLVEDNMTIEMVQRGVTRVPAIFRNGKLFGGYPDLIQYYQSTPIDMERK